MSELGYGDDVDPYFAFSHPQVWRAAVCMMALSLIEPPARAWLMHRLDPRGELDALFTHGVAPLLRCGLVCLFLAMSYPAIFGLSLAPSLGDVLSAPNASMSRLMGILFVVSLLAPLSRSVLSRPAIVLPAQSLLATGTLFAWCAGVIGVTAANPWPHPLTLILLVIFCWANHRIVTWLAWLGARLLEKRFAQQDTRVWLEQGLEPWAQIPTMLVYGTLLGYQLAP